MAPQQGASESMHTSIEMGKAQEAIPAQHQPIAITWNKLTVTVRDHATKQPKQILCGVSGAAVPGRLLALMGASGAGKSTLLDVLAATTSESNTGGGVEVGGEVLVNGAPRRTRAFRALSCYVQQRDVLLCSATVREAVATSAALRLPNTLTASQRAERVEEVLRELDLLSCADTLIGDEAVGLKGVSGGQKRRVSLGIELIKDPAVIFLDEPTSGLDSEMALGVVSSLVDLARKGRTVVCTIHQPNSDITAMFDDLLLLSAGRVAYGGSWAGALAAFNDLGFVCPMYKNPTDYFLTVLHDAPSAAKLCDAHAAAEAAAAAAGRSLWGGATAPATAVEAAATTVVDATAAATAATPHRALDLGSSSPQAHPKAPSSHRDNSGTSKAPGEGAVAVVEQHGASWPAQVRVLAIRNLRNWLRNPNLLASELLQYVVIAIFVGLMYCASFSDDLVDGVNNRVAAVWFAFAIMSFTPSYTSVTSWDKDRLLLRREVSQRQYSLSAHYAARTACLIPFQALQCLLFVTVMYFFAGFQRDAAKFFTFYIALVLFQLISEGLGLICAILTRTATYAIILLTFLLLLLLSFTGFLVTRIPVYFRWVNKSSYLTYAFAALVESELDGLTFVTRDGAGGEVFVAGIDAVPHSVANDFSVSENLGVLAGMAVGMELIKLLALQVAYRFNMM